MTLEIAGVSHGDSGAVALQSLLDARFASRVFARDATLWGEGAAAEAAVRLGWTDFAATAQQVHADASALAKEFRAAGIDRFVLCGMGGSSLAPLVFAPRLTVLDSTHPAAVHAALGSDLSRTAVIVSSKSGGTVETLSHLAAFEAAFIGAGISPDDRIVVVTDPESELESAARTSGKRVFLADPDVGGRFSALTAFGVVPSVLAGADMSTIINEAAALRPSLTLDSAENPALVLAATLAAGLPDEFLLELHPDGSLPSELGLWIEQLVAESTGKDGTGILPVALPVGALPSGAPNVSTLRFGAHLPQGEGIRIGGQLGEQMLLWQVTTAALGFLLGVDPFNQPDVEAAKVATRETLDEPGPDAPDALAAPELLAVLRAAAPARGYLAIQAYVDPNTPGLDELLQTLRAALATALGIPVSLGYGPRYLHSTGQFHKGGPAQAAFLQILGVGSRDVGIPGAESSFGDLITAQANGDAHVLRERGRSVVSVRSTDVPALVSELLAALS